MDGHLTTDYVVASDNDLLFGTYADQADAFLEMVRLSERHPELGFLVIERSERVIARVRIAEKG